MTIHPANKPACQALIERCNTSDEALAVIDFYEAPTFAKAQMVSRILAEKGIYVTPVQLMDEVYLC